VEANPKRKIELDTSTKESFPRTKKENLPRQIETRILHILHIKAVEALEVGSISIPRAFGTLRTSIPNGGLRNCGCLEKQILYHIEWIFQCESTKLVVLNTTHKKRDGSGFNKLTDDHLCNHELFFCKIKQV
jgi:hypothetical protein